MSIASVAVVAAFLLPGIGTGAPTDSAHAASAASPADAASPTNAPKCAAAPNAAPPQGQHWYYRLNHVSHRKCWYLHATVALAPRAEAERPAESAYAEPIPPRPPESVPPSARNAEATEPAESAPPSANNAEATQPAASVPPSTSNAGAAQPAVSAPQPESNADPDQAQPHVTVLTVKPVPFVDTAIQPEQSASENVVAPPAPQTPPRDENTANDVGNNPPDNADKAPVQAVPDAARQDVATQTELAQTTDDANPTVRTNLAGMFLLLALAFGSAAVLIAIATKFVRRYGEPQISDHPDDAWLSYRAALQPDEEAPHDEQYQEAPYGGQYHEQYEEAPYGGQYHEQYDEQYEEQEVPYLDPQTANGLADLHEEQWIDQSSSAEAELSQAPFEDDAPSESWEPEAKDIALALRILQRARQSRVA